MLAPQVIADADTGTSELVFINAGGGAALSTFFCLVAGRCRAMGWVNDGFLHSGDKVRVHGTIPHDEHPLGFVYWHDADGSAWAARPGNAPKRLARGHEWSKRGVEVWHERLTDVWQALYGDAGTLRDTMPLQRDAVKVDVERR